MKYFKNTWINGSFEPETWNYFGHKGATTNNYNEGYNNKFNNSTILFIELKSIKALASLSNECNVNYLF